MSRYRMKQTATTTSNSPYSPGKDIKGNWSDGMKLKTRVVLFGIALTLLVSGLLLFTLRSSNYQNHFVTEKADTLWYTQKDGWQTRVLSKADFKTVTSAVSIKRTMKDYLPEILKVRTPGSKEIKEVEKFIVNTLQLMNYEVELDEFEDRHPDGFMVSFTNIIATLNPNAHRRLVLACHYDSKVEPVGFLGATDSACPCAMMLEVAKVIDSFNSYTQDNEDITLQLMFFDGEEAFKEWTATDSTYGSRHLSQKWLDEKFPRNGYSNKLKSIDLLVLLDLIGEPNPHFKNSKYINSKYFPELENIERRVRNGKSTRYFANSGTLYHVNIEDDHLPFFHKGVRITHLIPVPFPHSWHKMSDDGTNLDPDTIERLTKIVSVFVCEYLHIHDIH